MNGNILSYLKEYGDRTFSELPFNDVDSLILCQFVYLKFDGLVSDVNENLPPTGIGELADHPGKETLFSDKRYEKINRKLFLAMAESKRFGGMRIGAYVNLIEKDWETQFSAVTFFLEGEEPYLAFRGTDESLVGWKEDCNMAFLKPIPSQRCALKYLNLMAGRLKGSFSMGGHSKGGNLAIYAAMTCAEDVRERIRKIYCMDGPGFRPEIRRDSAYDKIEDRIVKILPHSSFIGMLFERETKYQVVESKRLGLNQHDPFSWIVREGRFVQAPDVYKSRKFMDQAINDWILTLSEDQIKMFTDTLFYVLEASEAEDLVKMGEDKKKSMLGMVSAMKGLDDGVKQGVKKILGSLFEIAGEHALAEIDQKVKKLESGFKAGSNGT